MKVCFASENQETNVSTKNQEINRETTYVQKAAGNQVQDDQSKVAITENEKGKVLISNNGSEPIVLVARPGDQSSGTAGHNASPTENKQTEKSPVSGSSTQFLDCDDEETFLFQQPEWFTNLDEISRGKVREYCELAGRSPTAESEHIKKLKTLFNIDLEQAIEVNELYHNGRLEGPSRSVYKSILKTSTTSLMSGGDTDNDNAGVTISRRLSWLDEQGGSLVQHHEMESWHYMDSHRRSTTTQCCLIL